MRTAVFVGTTCGEHTCGEWRWDLVMVGISYRPKRILNGVVKIFVVLANGEIPRTVGYVFWVTGEDGGIVG